MFENSALSAEQVQYGIMRLTFGEGWFTRSHWVFVCWSPDSMTKGIAQKLRKKRMSNRMKHVSWKGYMQKLIGPYGVQVLAESLDMVTLETWILRVRKTVVVDGSDDFLSPEAFLRALEAEKSHFEAIRMQKEAEKEEAKRLELELAENEQSSSEDDEYKHNSKRKKRKRDDIVIIEENKENICSVIIDDSLVTEDESENEPPSQTYGSKYKLKVEVHVENTDNESVTDTPLDSDFNDSRKNTPRSRKRKSSLDPNVAKAREISSQLCYESVTLMKRPTSDLVWVLIEPYIKQRKYSANR